MESEAAPPPSESGFRGSIDGASMADLVQMECLRGLTRAVRVASGRQTGFLFFDQGQLVHAELGGLVGERAAVAMLNWEGGTFQPVQRYFTDAPSISTSWQALLLMVAKDQDDAGRPGSSPRSESNALTPKAVSSSGGRSGDSDGGGQSPSRADPRRSASSSRAASPGGGGGGRGSLTPPGRPPIAGGRPAPAGPTQTGPAEAVPAETGPTKAGPTETGLSAGTLSRIRFNEEGALLEGVGDAEGLLDASAYMTQLAGLIGEALGMPQMRALECARTATTIFCARDDPGHLALEAAATSADLVGLRKKAGL